MRTREEAGAYGRVRGFVVDVHECAADVRQDLDLVLQLLAEVVRLPQRRARGHHHVHLDVVLLQPPKTPVSISSHCAQSQEREAGTECTYRTALQTRQALVSIHMQRGGSRGTDVVRAHGVNLLNLVTERHRFVYDELDELVWRGFPCEQLELEVYCAAPRNDDAERNLK